MSREIARRLANLERSHYGTGAAYVVLDYPPEDDEREPYHFRPEMTEADWISAYVQDAGLNAEPAPRSRPAPLRS